MVVAGTQESSRAGQRTGGANDPIDAYLDHLEQHGSEAAMPMAFMPGHELGYVVSQGRPKLNCVATWSSIFTRLILGRLILLVTDPGGRRHFVAHMP